ncbi:hypothetical protein [Ruminococcus flavefaciens]|uniref:Uncharacterized protein n=1 Tax=Ruminococcus flavefaciens TaxID=1265 RepID=A0A1K1N9B9_RUMFL|nr:hypothetical protein [Ruminococcus flavefaciens]SFW30942.1 hypothetical protein SAMN02910280_1767 [Ruminococcus flavefaciens]
MKTEKNNKLRGTVLFTVVAVMALLIIFLTGTLALATASSNRAHKSYSSSQASYTAKTAITAFTRALGSNADVRDKVINLGINGNPTEIHPSITFRDGTSQDKSIGLVGFWGDDGVWHDNQITVERETMQDPSNPENRVVKTEWVYSVDENGVGKWIQTERVKITATARVGREESTVTAYLSKKPGTPGSTPSTTTNNSNPGGIKGLNTVGDGIFRNGGRYTGGVGLGLSTSSMKDKKKIQYELLNSVELDTTLTFINADLYATSGTFSVNVNQAPDIPVSQTVVNGNLYIKNDTFIELDYKMKHDFTQKQIPYLYVDGAMGFASASRIVANKGDEGKYGEHSDNPAAPFNIFVGTLRANKNTYLVHGDIYMMDEYDSTKNEKYIFQGENINEEAPKGDNIFGDPNAGANQNQLYKWAYDTVNKTETQNKSFGGSMYCNGQLQINGAEIDGDVRVVKDCILKNTHIHGDLVVGGNITQSGLIVDGKIYCDSYYAANGGTTDNNNNDIHVPEYVSVNNIYHGPESYDPEKHPEVDWGNISDLLLVNYPPRNKIVWNTSGHSADGKNLDILGNETDYAGTLYYSWAEDNWTPSTKVCISDEGVELMTPDDYDNLTADQKKSFDVVKNVEDIIKDLQNSTTFERSGVEEEVLNSVLKVETPEREEDNPEPSYTVKIVPVFDNGGQPVMDNNGEVIRRETSIPTTEKTVLINKITGEVLQGEEVPHYNKASFDNKDTGENVGAQKVTWYNKETQEEVSEAEATALPEGSNQSTDPNAKIQRLTGSRQVTYPENMKREKIYGSYAGGSYQGAFTPAPKETKIIKTLQEVRVDLGLKEDGTYPDYPSTLEEAAGKSVADALYGDDGKPLESAIAIIGEKTPWGGTEPNKKNASDINIWDGNTIVGSCVITGALNGAEMNGNPGAVAGRVHYKADDTTYNGSTAHVININPKGKTIWVVLDNVGVGNNVEIHVDRYYDGKECGKVNFFIKGSLSGDKTYDANAMADHLCIVNKKVVNETPLLISMKPGAHQNTDFGMEFYGETDSSIELSNECTLTGTFKCPYTDFSATKCGKYKVHYVDEYGIDWSGKPTGGQERGMDMTGGCPVIIGNALFHDVLDTRNEFGLFYTETGQIGEGNNDAGDDNPDVVVPDPTPGTNAVWVLDFYSAT